MSCLSSFWRRDLTPRPLKHESPPITTRPGLPPLHKFVFDAGKIKGFTALALEREILGSTKKVIKLEQSCKSSITCNEQCIEMVHISG